MCNKKNIISKLKLKKKLKWCPRNALSKSAKLEVDGEYRKGKIMLNAF